MKAGRTTQKNYAESSVRKKRASNRNKEVIVALETEKHRAMFFGRRSRNSQH